MAELNLKPIETKPKHQPLYRISNLAAALRMFVPVIVNENPDNNPLYQQVEGGWWTGDFDLREGAPTMPQLINAASGAIEDVHQFIQTHEKLKECLISTQNAFMAIQSLVLVNDSDETLKPASVIQAVNDIVASNNRMRDILTSAAGKSPTAAFDIIQNWLFPNGTAPKLHNEEKATEAPAGN